MNNNSKSRILLTLAIAAAMVLLVTITNSVANADHHTNSISTQTQNGSSTSVSVGKGNLTVSYNQFFPQNVEISAGESVTFTNPTPEVHNVVFGLDNETISDIVLPFEMTPAPQFELLPPYNLGEPIVQTDANGTQVLVTLNKVAFLPSVVDNRGNIQYLNGTDVSYTISGNESTVSSGIILPTEDELMAMFMQAFPEEMALEEEASTEQQSQNTTESEHPEGPPIQNINSFTVTFDQPGKYQFFCAFHPAMYGEISVD